MTRRCSSSVVFWETDANGISEQPPPSANELVGKSNSYSNRDMCSSPARDMVSSPLYLHSVLLMGLTPGAFYRYKIRYGSSVRFRAPLAPGPEQGLRFLAFGDMGESEHRAAKSPGGTETSDRLAEEVDAGAELIYHIGDLSYANGRKEIWDTFMSNIEPAASRVPYMVGIGNHEYDWRHGGGKGSDGDPSGADHPYDPDWGNYGNDSGGECGVAAAMRFSMPGDMGSGRWDAATTTGVANTGSCGNPTLRRNGAVVPGATASCLNSTAANRATLPANPPFWYAFSQGPVRFVTLSTEHDLRPGSEQYAWLEQELARVDRCMTPWLVVGMHRPMYVVFPHKSNRIVGEHLREQLESLLSRYEVDLVLSGHVHSYSRSCNVFDGACLRPAEGGMTHVIVGTGGRKLSGVEWEQFDWVASTEERFGYLRITVKPDAGPMHLEFVGTDDERVYDSTTLLPDRSRLRLCGAAAA